MDKEVLKSVILSQKSDLRFDPESFIYREELKRIDALISDPAIIIISGIRRSGKSVLLQYIKNQVGGDYFFNFDDNRIADFSVSDFEYLYEGFMELFGKQDTFYFDEIQIIPGWERFIRRLHNEWKKVFITGSNAQLLSRELGTHLTGRNIQLELYPFSFREFLKYKKFTVWAHDIYLMNTQAAIKNFFDEYLEKWGFPLYLQYGNLEFFTNLYNNIVYKDVIIRYKLRDEKVIKDLIHFLNSNIAKEVSYTKLKNILGVSNANSIKEYIHYFENSYLLFAINKFDYSLKKQLLNPKKIYSIDTGFSSSVSFEFSKNLGQKLENIVFIELKRQGKEIFYHRDKKECDFVVRDRGTIREVFQVSHSLSDPDTRKRELDGLLEAMEAYKLDKWYILTYDTEEVIEKNGKQIHIIPTWKWLFLSELR